MQPFRCSFCDKPRQTAPQMEVFYLVEISGPYLPQFDEDVTTMRSTNRKNMWGCRDCINVLHDSEYWAKYDELTGHRPYYVWDDMRKRSTISLTGKRLMGKIAADPTEAARKFKPVPFRPKRKFNVDNENAV